MALELVRSSPMFTPRQRERRQALANLLGTLARTALDRTADVAAMRSTFEQMLGRVVPVRTIRLRETNGRWGRPDGRTGSESITLDVPVPAGAAKNMLEATFDPASGLGDWDFQMLGMAAQLAGLVLEIERSRLQASRASSIESSRPRREQSSNLIGATPAMIALRDAIERVAATDFIVLLEGESGVGKELVARQIHERSRRRQGPFVAVNCAAIVETLLEAELFGIEDRTATGVRGRRGKFEHADGGTLFLDEIGDLSPSAQAKLLRAIQDLSVERVGGTGAHRVDIRVIAATNQSLAGLVDRRLFRADLFYRLSGVDIRIPPLRERRADVLVLAEHFLERHRPVRRLQLSAAALDVLYTYDWPGNVRELERLIERAVALTKTDTIEVEDLPPGIRRSYTDVILPSLERGETMRVWGSRYARMVFERCHRNKREACRVLDISYHTLCSYLRLSSQAYDAPQTRPLPADTIESAAPCHPTASQQPPSAFQQDECPDRMEVDV